MKIIEMEKTEMPDFDDETEYYENHVPEKVFELIEGTEYTLNKYQSKQLMLKILYFMEELLSIYVVFTSRSIVNFIRFSVLYFQENNEFSYEQLLCIVNNASPF